jgi:undecaprenyl-diphosphatase
MTAPLLMRLSAHDRALRTRCSISPAAPRASLIAWTAVTHLGGTGPSLLTASLPLVACWALHQASSLALMTLVVSHLLVQLVKRTVVRDRPAKVERCVSLVREPDRFSSMRAAAAARGRCDGLLSGGQLLAAVTAAGLRLLGP